jgi:hypothetical protein
MPELEPGVVITSALNSVLELMMLHFSYIETNVQPGPLATIIPFSMLKLEALFPTFQPLKDLPSNKETHPSVF